MWVQNKIILKSRRRGFHLVTNEVIKSIPELIHCKVGLLHLFIQHTSASLAINENADPDVRTDLESYFNQAIPENEPYYCHVLEGSDDMPAHIKAVVIGGELTIPISNGQLQMGVWQGIYLCEHRNNASKRRIVITVIGN